MSVDENASESEGCREMMTHVSVDENASKGRQGDDDTRESVSYTHLDVYKRQDDDTRWC